MTQKHTWGRLLAELVSSTQSIGNDVSKLPALFDLNRLLGFSPSTWPKLVKELITTVTKASVSVPFLWKDILANPDKYETMRIKDGYEKMDEYLAELDDLEDLKDDVAQSDLVAKLYGYLTKGVLMSNVNESVSGLGELDTVMEVRNRVIRWITGEDDDKATTGKKEKTKTRELDNGIADMLGERPQGAIPFGQSKVIRLATGEMLNIREGAMDISFISDPEKYATLESGTIVYCDLTKGRLAYVGTAHVRKGESVSSNAPKPLYAMTLSDIAKTYNSDADFVDLEEDAELAEWVDFSLSAASKASNYYFESIRDYNGELLANGMTSIELSQDKWTTLGRSLGVLRNFYGYLNKSTALQYKERILKDVYGQDDIMELYNSGKLPDLPTGYRNVTTFVQKPGVLPKAQMGRVEYQKIVEAEDFKSYKISLELQHITVDLWDEMFDYIISFQLNEKLKSSPSAVPFKNENVIKATKYADMINRRVSFKDMRKELEDKKQALRSVSTTDAHFKTPHMEGIEYFPHQVLALNRLALNDEALVDVATGGGKTIIMASDALCKIEEGEAKRPCIVTPGNIIAQFKDEIHLYTKGSVNVFVISSQTERDFAAKVSDPTKTSGKAEMLKAARDLPPNSIILTTYSWLSKSYTRIPSGEVDKKGNPKFILEFHNPKLLKNFVGVDMVSLDEAHKIKNPSSKVSQATRGLSGVKIKRACSGTLISNNPIDIVESAMFVNPDLFGDRKNFIQQFAQDIQGSGKVGNNTKVKTWAETSLKRIRDRLLDYGSITIRESAWSHLLPAKKMHFHFVEMPPQLRKAYDQVMQDVLDEIMGDPKLKEMWDKMQAGADSDDEDGAGGEFQPLIARLGKLETLTCSPMSTDVSKLMLENFPEEQVSPKVKKIDEILDHHFAQFPDKKGLVFFQQRERAYHFLKNSKWANKAVYYDAGNKKALNTFKTSPTLKLLVGVDTSLREGLNIVEANVMVRADVHWSPGDTQQVEARIYRHKQQAEVHFHTVLMENSIDIPKYCRLVSKMHINNKVLSEYTDDENLTVVSMNLETLDEYRTQEQAQEYVDRQQKLQEFVAIENADWRQKYGEGDMVKGLADGREINGSKKTETPKVDRSANYDWDPFTDTPVLEKGKMGAPDDYSDTIELRIVENGEPNPMMFDAIAPYEKTKLKASRFVSSGAPLYIKEYEGRGKLVADLRRLSNRIKIVDENGEDAVKDILSRAQRMRIIGKVEDDGDLVSTLDFDLPAPVEAYLKSKHKGVGVMIQKLVAGAGDYTFTAADLDLTPSVWRELTKVWKIDNSNKQSMVFMLAILNCKSKGDATSILKKYEKVYPLTMSEALELKSFLRHKVFKFRTVPLSTSEANDYVRKLGEYGIPKGAPRIALLNNFHMRDKIAMRQIIVELVENDASTVVSTAFRKLWNIGSPSEVSDSEILKWKAKYDAYKSEADIDESVDRESKAAKAAKEADKKRNSQEEILKRKGLLKKDRNAGEKEHSKNGKAVEIDWSTLGDYAVVQLKRINGKPALIVWDEDNNMSNSSKTTLRALGFTRMLRSLSRTNMTKSMLAKVLKRTTKTYSILNGAAIQEACNSIYHVPYYEEEIETNDEDDNDNE